MKLKIRNLMTYVNVFVLLLFVFVWSQISVKSKVRNDFFVSLNTNDDGEGNDSTLDFIKSNDGVMDFIGDGKILLYGGISLVAVSVAGIVFVLVPKKKNSNSHYKKRHQKSDYDNEE